MAAICAMTHRTVDLSCAGSAATLAGARDRGSSLAAGLRQRARGRGNWGEIPTSQSPRLSVRGRGSVAVRSSIDDIPDEIPPELIPDTLKDLVLNDDGDLVDTKTGKVLNEFGATRFDVAVQIGRAHV